MTVIDCVGMRPLHLAGSPSGPSRGWQGPDRQLASLDISLQTGNQMKLFLKNLQFKKTHPSPSPKLILSKLKPRQLRVESRAPALFSCPCEVLGLADKFRPIHGRLWAMGSGLLALGQRGFFLISGQLSSRHFLPSGIHCLVSLQARPHHPSPRGELLCPSPLILWPSIYHSSKIIVKYTWHKVYQDSLLAQWLRLCISRSSNVGGVCSVLWLGN